MTIDIGQIVTIGGPTSIISVLTYVLINAYLSARKDRREQQAADVTNETGYIDNIKQVLAMIRLETELKSKENENLRARNELVEEENRNFEKELIKRDDIIARLERENEWLREANQRGGPTLHRHPGTAHRAGGAGHRRDDRGDPQAPDAG